MIVRGDGFAARKNQGRKSGGLPPNRWRTGKNPPLLVRAESEIDSGGDAQIILVVVGAVVVLGEEIVSFDGADADMSGHVEIDAAAAESGECVGRARGADRCRRETSGGVRAADQSFGERMQPLGIQKCVTRAKHVG